MLKDGREQHSRAVPCDLNANTEQDESYDSQYAVCG